MIGALERQCFVDIARSHLRTCHAASLIQSGDIKGTIKDVGFFFFIPSSMTSGRHL